MSTDKITESQQGRGVNSKLNRFLGLVLADVLHFKYIIVETLGKLSSLSLIVKYISCTVYVSFITVIIALFALCVL